MHQATRSAAELRNPAHRDPADRSSTDRLSGLRTSLQEIADAAGILPGSLYHHFESKEAILVELLSVHDDLNRIGQHAQTRLDEPDTRPAAEKITELGTAIADLRGERQGGPANVFLRGAERGSCTAEAVRSSPARFMRRCCKRLRAGRWSGYIKPDIDLPTLANGVPETMLQVGLDVIRDKASADQVARLMCRIILQGLPARPPSDGALDRSTAFQHRPSEGVRPDLGRRPRRGSRRQGSAYCARWQRPRVRPKGYGARLLIPDIRVAAAGLGTGTVYR